MRILRGGFDAARTTADTDTAAPLSEGTVRRVNAEAGSVTIAHGPLANLDMPPMTMSFQLRGNASLDGLAPGDRIRFAADQDGDAFIVMDGQKAPGIVFLQAKSPAVRPPEEPASVSNPDGCGQERLTAILAPDLKTAVVPGIARVGHGDVPAIR